MSGTRTDIAIEAITMTEPSDERKKGQGFAGFDDLVSKVDSVAPADEQQSTNAPRQQSGNDTSTESDDRTPNIANVHDGQPTNSGSDGWGKILIFGVIGLFLFAVFSELFDNSNSSYSSPSNSPSRSTGGLTAPATNSLTESKPPIGTNHVHSGAQIRYCLAEEIRLETMVGMTDDLNDSELDWVNEYINDYNSRCSSYRYQSGALGSAERKVRGFRTILKTEGQNRIFQWRS